MAPLFGFFGAVVEDLQKVGESEGSPEGLAFGVAYGDLNLGATDLGGPDPGQRGGDEAPADALTALSFSHAQVGDLGTRRLLEDRRCVIDPHDAHAGQIAVAIEHEDRRVAIPVDLPDELAQRVGSLCIPALGEKWIEARVVMGDRRPQGGDAVEVPQLCRTNDAGDGVHGASFGSVGAIGSASSPSASGSMPSIMRSRWLRFVPTEPASPERIIRNVPRRDSSRANSPRI